MAKNNSLTSAKKVKNDEFYTQYEDIQKEINAYVDFNPDTFRNKTVLLPCDDPEWSNFTKFFAQNFESLGLKKLISTSYSTERKNSCSGGYQFCIEDFLTSFEKKSDKFDESITFTKGKVFVLEKNDSNSEHIDIEDLEWEYLEGDGDFRSEEVGKLRDEADIIITNPPFSMFREFIEWIYEKNKQFIIVGNKNSITYKEVFPRIMKNRMWVGSRSINSDFWMIIPEGMPYEKEIDGKKLKHIMACWFTNIEHGRRHQFSQFMTMDENIKYSKHKEIIKNGYPKYENYDCIEVKYIDAIPSDYNGVMGVPITFIDKYCPEQFVILGSVDANILPDGWQGLTQEFIDLYYEQGNTGALKPGNRLAGFIDNEGKVIMPYKRILVQRKNGDDYSG